MARIDVYLRPPKKKRPAASQQPQRGPVQPARAPEYLPRRLRNKINLWDLGLIKSGSEFVTLPFNVDTGLSYSYPTQSNPQTDLPPFTVATHWLQLRNLIFDVPLAEWKDNFKRIDHAAGFRYGFTVNGSLLDGGNANWTEQGLKPQAKISVGQSKALMSFDLNDTANFKVTASNDFAAPHVDISLAGGADVFIIPQPVFLSATNSGGSDPPQAYDADFYGMWALHSREVLLGKTKRVSGVDIPMFRPNNGSGRWASNDTSLTYEVSPGVFDDDALSSAFKNEMYDWWKSLPAAKFHVRRITGGVSSNAFEPVSSFPLIDSSPYFEFVIFFTFPFDSGSSTYNDFIELGAGVLRAVIKIGSNYYYVWSKTVRFDDARIDSGFWTYQFAP